MDSSTLIRRVDTTAMLVRGGGASDASMDTVAEAFEALGLVAFRSGHVREACDTLALVMPRVVVVLGALGAGEREALGDRATAVGALVVAMDPELDRETLTDFVGRAATVARERALGVDGGRGAGDADDAGTKTTTPPAPDDDIDSGWGDPT